MLIPEGRVQGRMHGGISIFLIIIFSVSKLRKFLVTDVCIAYRIHPPTKVIFDSLHIDTDVYVIFCQKRFV